MNPERIGPRVDSRRAKLAGRAAEQIVNDVVELGWPVGQVLGSETELLERYGVSRAVLREAIRLVEHQRVARMRRGTGGGLVIDEPDVDAVIGPAVIYLLRVGATLDEIFDTRILLEELAAELATQRIAEADQAAVRDTVDREAEGRLTDFRELHTQLAVLSGNPVLELFVETFSRVCNFHFSDVARLPADIDRAVLRAHRGIAKAVLANDPALARERMRRHLRAEADFIRAQPATVQRLDPDVALAGTLGDKRGEALARQIFAELTTSGATPGTFVGSEAALMEKYRASRAVVREAIRILEYHQIALTRRGPGGGLFVTEPDISAVVDIFTIYLRRHGVKVRHIADLRVGLELAVVERAAEALKSGGANSAAIEAALRAESEHGPATAFGHGEDFHSMLGRLTGNRALSLVHGVTMRLGWQFFSQFAIEDPRVGAMSQELPSTVVPAHQSIADALLAGDAELAVARMRDHMAATGPS
ncbi:FadR/GntR family transcriptional regulator [Mycolicibacterium elephantis]|uniref:GntR family transcriptional regulator n=1 Tax=Mycolicibacterium elephantis DSM 44368 TaxID=1335622 RepID=A0A439DVB5_9MYCO|nr:FCD domain-containing protein [Mycolicibacterium elephantis]MCV7220746.1 FadR family transcriptional regulator [Mycolicibacterium elephantis]RWA20966.1 GntR family transcriptional regulator [Mycolicibacterium elephantis DSM 44368]